MLTLQSFSPKRLCLIALIIVASSQYLVNITDAAPSAFGLNIERPSDPGAHINHGESSVSETDTNTSSPLQFANTISADGKDPLTYQVRNGAGKAFAPIGFVSTDTKVPTSFNPDPKSHAIPRDRLSGSGFLISPCLMLTAYHVALGSIASPSDSGELVSFVAGEKNTSNYEEAKGHVIGWGEFQDDDHGHGHDYAIVQLDADSDGRCAGEKIGWIEISTKTNEELQMVHVASAGFPLERSSEELSIDLRDTNKIIC